MKTKIILYKLTCIFQILGLGRARQPSGEALKLPLGDQFQRERHHNSPRSPHSVKETTGNMKNIGGGKYVAGHVSWVMKTVADKQDPRSSLHRYLPQDLTPKRV